jgi:hypothetical protein
MMSSGAMRLVAIILTLVAVSGEALAKTTKYRAKLQGKPIPRAENACL